MVPIAPLTKMPEQRQDLSAIIFAEKCGTALGNNTKLCGESAAKNGNSAAKVRRKTEIVRQKCGQKRKFCGKSAAQNGNFAVKSPKFAHAIRA
jgi:hypothetical protein